MVSGCQLAAAVDHEQVRSSGVTDVMTETADNRGHPDELSRQTDHLLDPTEHVAALHDSDTMLVIVERIPSLVVLVLKLLQECCQVFKRHLVLIDVP